jgi:hypothetical protein
MDTAGDVSGVTGTAVDVQCATGYSGTGTMTCTANGATTSAWDTTVSCTDIDECNADDGTHMCDTNAVCADADGSYDCTCNAGYSGAGYTGMCAAATCAATQVPNSNKSDTGSITGTTTAEVDVACDDGYSGDGTMTCTASGAISSAWDTTVSCTAATCGATQVANSNKSDAGSITGTTTSEVDVACDDGYSVMVP